MPTTSQEEIEVLRPAKTPRLKRLWVRIALVLMLIWVISFATWWWPRKTMVAVWRVQGDAFNASDPERAIAISQWSDFLGVPRHRTYFSEIWSVLCWTHSDVEITHVRLMNSKVTDEWLIQLNGFPKLRHLHLHERQLGPGLARWHGAQQLAGMSVTSASNRRLAELRWIPQLQSLMLWNPMPGDIGLDALSSLPHLKVLHAQRSTKYFKSRNIASNGCCPDTGKKSICPQTKCVSKFFAWRHQ